MIDQFLEYQYGFSLFHHRKKQQYKLTNINKNHNKNKNSLFHFTPSLKEIVDGKENFILPKNYADTFLLSIVNSVTNFGELVKVSATGQVLSIN